MKLSEIRAQYPQYNDLSDDQLLIGLHKKFYSDIPIGKFTQQIEYDTQRADPTAGMNEGEKFRAGAGKAVADLGRGIGQYFGVVSRDDVAESRKLDAPLMKGAGSAGNVAGNVAAMLPAAFIPGANTLAGAGAIGAVTGAIQPSVSTKETLTNTAIGGVSAPATMLALRGGQALYEGAKGLTEPLTKAGQERIAARVIQASATDPAKAAQVAAQAREFIPGSQPTLAQAAADPGLAQLERAVVNMPEYAPALQARFGAQRAARAGAIESIAKDQPAMQAATQARDDAAKVLYGKAFDADAMRQGLVQEQQSAARSLNGAGGNVQVEALDTPGLRELMQRPMFQKAAQTAKTLAADNGVALSDPTKSLQGLHYIKLALDDMSQTTASNALSRNAMAAAGGMKKKLENELANVAPLYGNARQTFADMSKPINQMEIGQELANKMRPALADYGATTNETAATFAKALREADATAARATGYPGAKLADVLSPEQMALVEGVAKDFGRKAFVDNAGKAVGSNTMQNMASQNMLRRMLGPAGLPESWAESTMLQAALSPVQMASKLTGADKRIMERITQGLLDPKDGVGLLSAPAKAKLSGLLSAPNQKFVPAATTGLLNYYNATD